MRLDEYSAALARLMEMGEVSEALAPLRRAPLMHYHAAARRRLLQVVRKVYARTAYLLGEAAFEAACDRFWSGDGPAASELNRAAAQFPSCLGADTPSRALAEIEAELMLAYFVLPARYAVALDAHRFEDARFAAGARLMRVSGATLALAKELPQSADAEAWLLIFARQGKAAATVRLMQAVDLLLIKAAADAMSWGQLAEAAGVPGARLAQARAGGLREGWLTAERPAEELGGDLKVPQNADKGA